MQKPGYKQFFLIFSIAVLILLYLYMNSYNYYDNQNQLIDITSIDSSIKVDLKYATKDNFLGRPVYSDNTAKLLPLVATKLIAAQKEFNKHGVGIKIWDAYRPLYIQQIMWDILPDERYIANPKVGGRHTRGTTVDITLVNLQTGEELLMPTKFDNFSEKAHRNYQYTNPKIKSNMKLLDSIMQQHGFIGLPTEWWHYDLQNWQQYPVITDHTPIAP